MPSEDSKKTVLPAKRLSRQKIQADKSFWQNKTIKTGKTIFTEVFEPHSLFCRFDQNERPWGESSDSPLGCRFVLVSFLGNQKQNDLGLSHCLGALP